VLARAAADPRCGDSTRDTWRNTRPQLNRIHLITMATGDGQVAQRSVLSDGHKATLAALDLPEPPRFFDFTVPAGN
jgi:hypothetical protein